jgi:hypothetical protein
MTKENLQHGKDNIGMSCNQLFEELRLMVSVAELLPRKMTYFSEVRNF